MKRSLIVLVKLRKSNIVLRKLKHTPTPSQEGNVK
jgi:hypothetical protein